MPHRPNPIPRFNNPQYATTTLTSGQSTSSTVQNAPQPVTSSSRRDLNTVPPRHRGNSFSATTPPSIANQDGNVSNRGERTGATGGGTQRTLPPPRFQRKQRPPRVQSILAGHDNVDRSLGTLTFGPMTNWGVGTQSVVSLPMAAVNAASSAMALSASPQPNVLPSSSSTLNAPIDDFPSGFATSGLTQISISSIDSIPQPINNSPPHLSFGMSGSVPHSTSLPNPATHVVSFHSLPMSCYAGPGPYIRTFKYSHLTLCQLRVPSREGPNTGSCSPSFLAPYFAPALVPANGDYVADQSLAEPHLVAPSIGAVHSLSRDITPPKVDTVPPTPLKSALKHQSSTPNLAHTVYSSSLTYPVPEKPLPSTPVLHSAHNVNLSNGQEVLSRSPYVGELEYELDIIGAGEDSSHALDEESIHPSHLAGLDEWEELDKAVMYVAGVMEDDDYLPVLPPLAPKPVVRVSPPSQGSNAPPTAIPASFVESTALTRTARSRPVSTLSTHAHRIPPYVPQLRSRSRSPSPTLSGNGSCESAGSMGSLPGLGSFGSGSSKLSLHSTTSSRPSSMFTNNASMASLTSRSTNSSGRSLRTVDSHGSMRSTLSGAFGAGSLLGGSSIWAMDKEEAGAGAGIGTVGVAGGNTLSLVPEEGTGFGASGYGLPKGAAPALEPFGAFEPTPRRKNRPVSGFSNTTYAGLPFSLLDYANESNRFTNLAKKTASSAFHARVPSELSDNPFASIEALRGSPPSSPLHKASALTPVTQHVPLIPMAGSFVPRKGATSAIPTNQGSTAGGSSLSGNAKAFIPRASAAHDAQFSSVPFENIDLVSGRAAIRKVEDAFVGAAGIIGRGV